VPVRLRGTPLPLSPPLPDIAMSAPETAKSTSTHDPETRLRELGFVLPSPPAPVATYVGAVQVGNLLFVSGHGPIKDGEHLFIGKLGRDMDVEEGQGAARLVILNMLATIKHHLRDLRRVRRFVKLLCLVNSAPDFRRQPLVANGASDLLVEVFGAERGAHARSAIGMGALPFGIAVEIEGIVEVE
jgi:enamine deaminase RidA (YjgF/YER057c/UK114 family)